MTLLADIRRMELARLQATVLAEALAETEERLPTAPRSAAGDAARMRGLPMIGGVGGAIPGTRPGTTSHAHRIDRKRRAA